tara:strand:- start:35 stop:412 length:378 start_codon:yes stop_codon:yes gene_type:complete
MLFSSQNSKLQAIRGAITAKENSIESIKTAVNELISELVSRNKLNADQIVSITFSVTADLNACFPASIARQNPGWENVALIDYQQMRVQGDLKNCIRVLALAWLPYEQGPQHPYLGGAQGLRPDR